MPVSSSTLAALLAHPAIWRGDDCAPETAVLPSGFAALDAVLPGRGWPQAALTELLLEREGIGELRLTLPALARLQAQRRDVVWIAPPYRPYAPALAAAGLDLARLFIVRCQGCERSAVGVRAGVARARMRRRLRLAAHARRARAAPAAGGRARRRHLGRAVAPARPARQRHRRAAAPGTGATGRTIGRARAETPWRRTRAAGAGGCQSGSEGKRTGHSAAAPATGRSDWRASLR